MIKINLLANTPGTEPPREWLPRRQRSAAVGLILLMVTAVGVGGWWWYLRHEHAAVSARIAAAEGELQRLKNIAAMVEKAAARKTELAERLALIDRLRQTMRAPVNLLETVSRSLPDGLWLMELKQQGAFVQFEGRATSITSVTDFAELMQNSGLFQRPIEIVTTSTELVEDTSVIRFVVKAEAVPAVPVPGAVPATKPASASSVGTPSEPTKHDGPATGPGSGSGS
jgi:Tfp pilus assembly protein PilN